jgi:hypothetical protein
MIDHLCEAPVVNQSGEVAFAQAARQLGTEVFDNAEVERHLDAGRHGESFRGKKSVSYDPSVGYRAFEPDIDQPYLGAAEKIGGDQPGRLVAPLYDQLIRGTAKSPIRQDFAICRAGDGCSRLALPVRECGVTQKRMLPRHRPPTLRAARD